MKKPDATTVISEENYKRLVWPLPAGDLLYVGPATRKRLSARNLHTIGDLACCDLSVLREALGKFGDLLHIFANGLDQAPVARMEDTEAAKSIGNSMTTARDIRDEADVKWTFMLLAETVGARLRESGVQGSEVQIWVRDVELFSFERQKRLPKPTDIDSELLAAALSLFRESYGWLRPIRSLGIRVDKLSGAGYQEQTTLFDDPKREKERKLAKCIDALSERYDKRVVRPASLLVDTALCLDGPAEEYQTHQIAKAIRQS